MIIILKKEIFLNNKQSLWLYDNMFCGNLATNSLLTFVNKPLRLPIEQPFNGFKGLGKGNIILADALHTVDIANRVHGSIVILTGYVPLADEA